MKILALLFFCFITGTLSQYEDVDDFPSAESSAAIDYNRNNDYNNDDDQQPKSIEDENNDNERQFVDLNAVRISLQNAPICKVKKEVAKMCWYGEYQVLFDREG